LWFHLQGKLDRSNNRFSLSKVYERKTGG